MKVILYVVDSLVFIIILMVLFITGESIAEHFNLNVNVYGRALAPFAFGLSLLGAKYFHYKCTLKNIENTATLLLAIVAIIVQFIGLIIDIAFPFVALYMLYALFIK